MHAPRTTDDVGWLKTLDEYYAVGARFLQRAFPLARELALLFAVATYTQGANNSIQHAAVQFILDSVVNELPRNPDRKFIYVEQAFFQHWWFDQDDETRAQVRELVLAGQLEFTNAGWDMHDEANPTYIDMIDQTTLGNRFLLRELGVVPKVTWQIDPFGHSAAQQSLLTALSGYDALYAARIDYQDKAVRAASRSLETIWRASPSLGAGAQSLFGTLYYHYCPPPGLNFDVSNPHATPVSVDPRLEGLQPDAQAILNTFLEDAREQASAYQGNHIMFTMGCDFQYEQAAEWYANLDALIHLLNANGSVNVFYSTPEQYTAAKHAESLKLPLKTDDFFPYADQPFSYWTGYMTSRPALKGYVRTESAYLQAARALMLAANATGLHTPRRSTAQKALSASNVFQEGSTPPWQGTSLSALEHAMGTLQHHDAVAGTEQQHVAFDYAKKLYAGHAVAQVGTDSLLTHLTKGATGWSECQLSNVSMCQATAKGMPTVLALVNQQAQPRNFNVRLPVGIPSGVASWHVSNASGHVLPAQLLPLSARDVQLRRINGGAASAPMAWLAFQTELPAYGFSTVFLQPTQSAKDAPKTRVLRVPKDAGSSGRVTSASLRGTTSGNVVLSNGKVAVTLDSSTGLLSHLSNLEQNVSAQCHQEWRLYRSSPGVPCTGPCQWGQTQASGAYIFRPDSDTPVPVSQTPATVTVVAQGPVVWETRHTVSEWLTQETRLWAGESTVEVQWTVGPIPISDGWGKEVIHRLSTDLASRDTWYTDSNGRDMVQRKLNHRDSWKLNVTQPVSGNYAPINAAIQLREEQHEQHPRVFTLVNDRSQGGASLAEGAVEVMVHRRLLHDDARGVGQALNETGLTGDGLIVRGVHWLTLDTPTRSAKAQRQLMQSDFFRPLLKAAPLQGLTPPQWLTKFVGARRGMATNLPPNVHLLTVDTANYGPGVMLLRLAHLYEVGEDAVLSQPATVQLAGMFRGLTLTSATETTLRGNADVADVQPLLWQVQGEGEPEPSTLTRWAGEPPSGPNLEVVLRPMEIRTFLARFQPL